MTDFATPHPASPAPHVLIVGNGMVGHRFVDALRAQAGPDILRVTVINRAAPDAARPSRATEGDGLPGGGHGLIGLRERAELLDGVLQHGPLPGGGFRLELVVPAHRSASGDLRSVEPAPPHGG